MDVYLLSSVLVGAEGGWRTEESRRKREGRMEVRIQEVMVLEAADWDWDFAAAALC